CHWKTSTFVAALRYFWGGPRECSDTRRQQHSAAGASQIGQPPRSHWTYPDLVVLLVSLTSITIITLGDLALDSWGRARWGVTAYVESGGTLQKARRIAATPKRRCSRAGVSHDQALKRKLPLLRLRCRLLRREDQWC